MGNGVKILLIVVGSFIGLLVLAVSVLVFVIAPRALANIKNDMTDPVAQHKLAASIANFDVPPGYKQSLGMNMFMIKMVTLEPVNKTHRHFTIILEGIDMPTASSDEMQANIDRSLGQSASTSRCQTPEAGADEIIKAKTRSITLHVKNCTDPGNTTETAMATFPGTSKVVMVVATGNKADFDLVAVRQLLASVR
jgi:hypothetical protein